MEEDLLLEFLDSEIENSEEEFVCATGGANADKAFAEGKAYIHSNGVKDPCLRIINAKLIPESLQIRWELKGRLEQPNPRISPKHWQDVKILAENPEKAESAKVKIAENVPQYIKDNFPKRGIIKQKEIE